MLPVSILPHWLRYNLSSWYFKNRAVHEGVIEGTCKLVQPYCLRNVTNMANEEMQKVDVPDYHLLQRYRHTIWFYYGVGDGWCPVNYCHDMRRRYPDANVTLCSHGIAHAFCMESSIEMAELTWKKLTDVLTHKVLTQL